MLFREKDHAVSCVLPDLTGLTHSPTGQRLGEAAYHSPPDKPGQKGRVRDGGAIAETTRTPSWGARRTTRFPPKGAVQYK